MIGYYAHSQGAGHCNYANVFSKVFGKFLTVFTDRDHAFDAGVDVVRLANENPDGSEFDRNKFPEPRALHYAPVNMQKITARNHSLLDVILKKGIKLLIVDVSVEIAMLARISSVPYAYVRLHGDRNDFAHLNAYEGASFLLAYYPEEMEDRDTPPWVKKKTVYLGFLSRYMFGNKGSGKPIEYSSLKKPILLHITGFGGTLPLHFTGLSRYFDICSIGPGRIPYERSNVLQIGVVECTRAFIENADVVVAACGSNTVAEIFSLDTSFIAVPEERHYREQKLCAKNLHRLGWAINLEKYASLHEAVGAFRKLEPANFPKVRPTELLAFFWTLKMLDFRVDRLLEHLEVEANRFSGSEIISKPSSIPNISHV